MKVYIYANDTYLEELVNNIIFNYNLDVVDNLNDADIIFINNFSLQSRKLLIKNKHIWNTKKIICYIHEPLCDNDDANFNKKTMRRLNHFPFINILSYSMANIKLSKKLLANKIINYFPINYYNYIDIKHIKEIDGVIIYRYVDPLTDNILNRYRKEKFLYNEKIITKKIIDENKLRILNVFNEEKDKLFSKTKIFINLHRKMTTNFLETLRIHSLIYNRVIIISQKCANYEDPLSKYVIFTDNDKLIEKYNDKLNFKFLYNFEQDYKKELRYIELKETFEPILNENGVGFLTNQILQWVL